MPKRALSNSPRDMQVKSAPMVRPIGPHRHTWEEVGMDDVYEVYQQCSACGARRARSGDISGAKRQDWLTGGPWEVNGEALSFNRRRGRPRKVEEDDILS